MSRCCSRCLTQFGGSLKNLFQKREYFRYPLYCCYDLQGAHWTRFLRENLCAQDSFYFSIKLKVFIVSFRQSVHSTIENFFFLKTTKKFKKLAYDLKLRLPFNRWENLHFSPATSCWIKKITCSAGLWGKIWMFETCSMKRNWITFFTKISTCTTHWHRFEFLHEQAGMQSVDYQNE